MYERDTETALEDLMSLTALGPRFHGTPGIHNAQKLLTSWLHESGATVETHEVRTADWKPGNPALLRVTAPVERQMVAWPMLWSGPSTGAMTARLRPVGLQGIWGDAMIWTKYAAIVGDEVVGYVHARDDGPAAPQPLPVGSDTQLPHVAIGRIDGLAISEWLDDGYDVEVVLEATSGPAEFAVSESLTVDIPPAGVPTGGRVIVCGHYDTFWNTPGAYDNGSGTIALLHLARSLLSDPIGRPVTIAHLTAEEWHLAGSRAFVAGMTDEERDDVDFVINLDGLGRGDFLEVFAGPEAFERDILAGIDRFRGQARPDLRVRSRFPPTCGTDHAAFYAAGIPAVHFTFNDLHRLHQPDDVPNEGIASNIAWTVALTRSLLTHLDRAERVPSSALTLPF